jgi:hypothetical protein
MGRAKGENQASWKEDFQKMVGWQGLEPWTNALKGHCSTN